HIFYFLFRAYIGYGDVLLISALSLFFPLQFTIYVILFTFVIAGLVALITMIFKPIKLLPLVPFIFISFFINSLFYNDIYQFLGGVYF
ncbi:prepilin peptidase, partial [Staphylococcus aureus]|nr:prepilin peptidase [Staphylococcus aureus]